GGTLPTAPAHGLRPRCPCYSLRVSKGCGEECGTQATPYARTSSGNIGLAPALRARQSPGGWEYDNGWGTLVIAAYSTRQALTVSRQLPVVAEIWSLRAGPVPSARSLRACGTL